MKKIIITLSLLTVAFTVHAQQTIELNNWKFETGDNMEWAQPGFNDADWKPMNVGVYWEGEGTLPPDWDNVQSVDLYLITKEGITLKQKNVLVSNMQLSLSLKPGEEISVQPVLDTSK